MILKDVAEVSAKNLGLESLEVTGTKVVSTFLWGGEKDAERMRDKNIILAYMIQRQQNSDLGIYIKNKCVICNGSGLDHSIFQTVDAKCTACNGTGWKIVPCSRCDGTGKIGDIPCYTCKGRGTYIYKKTDKFPGKKCLTCAGTGSVKKIIQKIDSLKLCSNCQGLGIVKSKNDLPNPVLSQEIGEELMKYLYSE